MNAPQTWHPYRPPWYPNNLPDPFTMNGETGSAACTHYEDWMKRLPTGELQRLINKYHEKHG